MYPRNGRAHEAWRYGKFYIKGTENDGHDDRATCAASLFILSRRRLALFFLAFFLGFALAAAADEEGT